MMEHTPQRTPTDDAINVLAALCGMVAFAIVFWAVVGPVDAPTAKEGAATTKKSSEIETTGPIRPPVASAAPVAPAGPQGIMVLETTKGTIKVKLDKEKAPITVKNIVAYVEDGFYDGLIFHRVIPDFMIQGGGFLPGMQRKEPGRASIKNEGKNGLKNERGTIAMARTSAPDSASSQFFINHKDNAMLDYPSPDGNGYAVFGKVVEGMDNVDAIAAVDTASKAGHGDVPVEDVVITRAYME
ncbi:MAG: peptidylprolyl isomerase [Candidatus Undinarchaeales archaeon]|jgi:cyclophilin family peptidyl-prolyl cis-trans isomerase|nr:peptidylprolyl isomerase [Candidatus Undinarchaeales archaeon]MDP7493516.1 peptidylprolyl isomerase [Candidatus Undinarchaeales archaeon]